ncbi:hypothetical protein [Sphingopyxis sp.]|uniref:hypothetical protein n=1 Tax=Sphingopyxis sp. TaxID=1908224 RepID=UPI00258844B5|nr:hypothetical protein [Sphingopyxis sp.]
MIRHDIILNGGVRSASVLAEIARKATDAQLGLAIQEQLHGPNPEAEEAARVFGDYYLLAARHNGAAVLDDPTRESLRAQGRSERHMHKLELLVRHNAGTNALSDVQLSLQCEQLGLSFDKRYADDDRRTMLTAWADAQFRAATFNTPLVQSQPEPIAFLLNAPREAIERARSERPKAERQDAGVSQQPARSVAADHPDPAPKKPTPILSELIDDVVAGIVSQGHWKDGPGSTAEDGKRLVKQFVWMVGDLPAEDYGQQHLSHFCREMMSMPKTVRVQTFWHEPYEAAKKKFPPLTTQNSRKAVTFNKDLAYLARFGHRMVTEGYWREGQISPLKFSRKVTVGQKSKAKSPWQPAHIEEMLASPIYVGNGGSKRRLKGGRYIHQDAAYWVLLLAVYTAATQGEICGLLVEEVVSEEAFLPHLLFQKNRLRSLKREAREREVPIHPRLIALGFLDYVACVQAEGRSEIFPELWINDVKRGGDQYRSAVWNKLINWLRPRGLAIPVGNEGKEADFHSLRNLVLSQLDRAWINQNIVKDIAGHARKGVTAQTYQNLKASGGLNDVLTERLSVLQCLPDFAAGVVRQTPRLLPIKLRSR